MRLFVIVGCVVGIPVGVVLELVLDEPILRALSGLPVVVGGVLGFLVWYWEPGRGGSGDDDGNEYGDAAEESADPLPMDSAAKRTMMIFAIFGGIVGLPMAMELPEIHEYSYRPLSGLPIVVGFGLGILVWHWLEPGRETSGYRSYGGFGGFGGR